MMISTLPGAAIGTRTFASRRPRLLCSRSDASAWPANGATTVSVNVPLPSRASVSVSPGVRLAIGSILAPPLPPRIWILDGGLGGAACVPGVPGAPGVGTPPPPPIGNTGSAGVRFWAAMNSAFFSRASPIVKTSTSTATNDNVDRTAMTCTIGVRRAPSGSNTVTIDRARLSTETTSSKAAMPAIA